MKILYLAYVWPEPSSSAAGIRQMNVIDAIRDASWDLIVGSCAQKTEFSVDLDALQVRSESFTLNDSSFDEWLKRERPEVVIFDRFVLEEQFGARVQTCLPECIRVVDTQDIHFLRLARKTGRALVEGGDEMLRELASLHRSDLAWVVSDFERDLLVGDFGFSEDKIHLSRIGWPKPEKNLPSYAERRNFIFLGNFRHPPNADAMKWVQEEIWPIIREKLPDAQLHVYGSYPLKDFMARDSKENGFRMMGRAKNLDEVLPAYRVNLAPLRFGAGIKGKILDGWRAHLPVVSTSLGAEGLFPAEYWGGRIADDPSNFAMEAVRLYQEELLWNQTSERGEEILCSEFLVDQVKKQIQGDLISLVQGKEARRSKDWFARILWMQQMRSSDYFSRWIELKNRLKGIENGVGGS